MCHCGMVCSCVCLCVRVMVRFSATMAGPIEMPFGLWGGVGPSNCIWWWSRLVYWIYKVTNSKCIAYTLPISIHVAKKSQCRRVAVPQAPRKPQFHIGLFLWNVYCMQSSILPMAVICQVQQIWGSLSPQMAHNLSVIQWNIDHVQWTYSNIARALSWNLVQEIAEFR